jgi:outer membrane protein W
MLFDFESKINLQVSAENHVMPNITVGIGIGYTSLDLTDTANNFITPGTQVIYNNGYNNVFGNGRLANYDRFTFEANTKFFLTVDSKIKPFVGATLGYNRSSIKYADSGNNYQTNNVTFGNEGFSSGYVSAGAKLGAEIDLAENVAMNLDLSYTKAITSGISSNSQVTNNNPDQLRLSNITNAMEKSDVTAIQVGVVVRF